ncbi:response regulator transcription factor [Evansella sp. AB-P1]|uniref:response regulator transcription factor n=1 Tax=Evansella sp. AB-P1 TaxID=3037653 RepID=UPI00241FCE0F|nr:response regulator transcription factor [Evansella sp. AB-P1]MDG5788032.1 response regulator transcription factor [Evansella sp. AB-P1]
MKVLIGVDHELLRNGLIQLLKDIQPIEYMVLASTTEEYIQALRKYRFELAVVDTDLPGAGGLKNIFSVQEILPYPPKRVFMFNEPVPELEEQFTNKKVEGIFHERMTLDELMIFFQNILNGERVYSKPHKTEHFHFSNQYLKEHLSKREEEVFYMKIRGYTVKDTAELLKISPKTVENHRRNIRKKLDIQKNSEWYEWGKRLGAI